MSYILDALAQAAAQRERGAVPGLNTPSLPISEAPQGRSRRPWSWLLAGALLAVLLALLGWFVLRPLPESAPQDPPLARAALSRVTAVEAPAVASLPAPVVAPGVAPVAATAPAAVPALVAAPVSAPAPAAVALPAAAGNTAVPDAASGLPKLAISGATYSDNPAYRMLVINGQVFQEGQEPAPGVLLEQIGPKSAVLSYQGRRHSVAY